MPEKHNKNQPISPSITYEQAGVSICTANKMLEALKPIVKATKRKGSDAEIGGFGGIFDLKALSYKDPLLVAANDGVGTKLIIAIETNIHKTIGIDLVAMCVNDLIVQGAEPLFFLDYFATGKLKPNQAVEVIAGISEGCQQANCALIGGETAEMPGLYQGEDYDLAGFSVGIVERESLLPSPAIKEGDILLGLASSGLHANGFSLVREIIKTTKANLKGSAPFPSKKKSLGEDLLTPTRIYVSSLLEAFKIKNAILGLAHITGGGFEENIPRILPQNLTACIDLSAIKVPPVFSWLAKAGNIHEKELLRVFNCGIGMVLIVNPDKREDVTEILKQQGESVTILGHICKNENEQKIAFKGSLAL